MPTSKNYRKIGHKKNFRNGLLLEKASPFHVRSGCVVAEGMLPRPRNVPDLVAGKRVGAWLPDVVSVQERPRELTKLLLMVTIQRSVGALQVVMPSEATVEDLVAAALNQYAKEGRRPVLPSNDSTGFDLHYSQFSLESLNREEKLMVLGSRNFFLCTKKPAGVIRDGDVVTTAPPPPSSYSNESWLKFMDILL